MHFVYFICLKIVADHPIQMDTDKCLKLKLAQWIVICFETPWPPIAALYPIIVYL